MGGSFRKAGYATGYIGKWHIYGSPEGKAERRLAQVPEFVAFWFRVGDELVTAYSAPLPGHNTNAHLTLRAFEHLEYQKPSFARQEAHEIRLASLFQRILGRLQSIRD